MGNGCCDKIHISHWDGSDKTGEESKKDCTVWATSFYNIEKPEHNKGNNNLRLNER